MQQDSRGDGLSVVGDGDREEVDEEMKDLWV